MCEGIVGLTEIKLSLYQILKTHKDACYDLFIKMGILGSQATDKHDLNTKLEIDQKSNGLFLRQHEVRSSLAIWIIFTNCRCSCI